MAQAKNDKKRKHEASGGELIRFSKFAQLSGDGSSAAVERAPFPTKFDAKAPCPETNDKSLVGQKVLHLWRAEGSEELEWKLFNVRSVKQKKRRGQMVLLNAISLRCAKNVM